ncbi:unnamed protein product [Victoria cruziana]
MGSEPSSFALFCCTDPILTIHASDGQQRTGLNSWAVFVLTGSCGDKMIRMMTFCLFDSSDFICTASRELWQTF